jgi:hypothetical protein
MTQTALLSVEAAPSPLLNDATRTSRPLLAWRIDCLFRLLLVVIRFQKLVKAGKWIGDGRRLMTAGRHAATVMTRHAELLVLVVVAIQAKQFPVAPIERIVVMVVVLVVHREFPQSAARELPAAPCANVRKQLQRTLSIARFPRLHVAPKLGPEPGLCFWISRFSWFLNHFHFNF